MHGFLGNTHVAIANAYEVAGNIQQLSSSIVCFQLNSCCKDAMCIASIDFYTLAST